MAEQGLRAMDLRHTLPNLKNLILTLTHNTESTPPYVLVCNFLVSCPESVSVSTIRIAPLPLDLPTEDSLPTPRAASPAPADTTPAPVPTRSKFLSPLAAILRSRYTGGTARPKVLVEVAEPAEGPDALTPTGTDSAPPTQISHSQSDGVNVEGNASASEDGTHKDETKVVPLPQPRPNGLEKLGDNLPVETPPPSPFSHTVN